MGTLSVAFCRFRADFFNLLGDASCVVRLWQCL